MIIWLSRLDYNSYIENIADALEVKLFTPERFYISKQFMGNTNEFFVMKYS